LLRIEDQLADNLYDEISGIVLTMAAKKTWNANCAVLFERLEKILSKKYKKFVGDIRTYHLTRKGQSCLYDIPANQLGFSFTLGLSQSKHLQGYRILPELRFFEVDQRQSLHW
jgi:hypothetical protein